MTFDHLVLYHPLYQSF